jgi:hypothetical protein
MTQALYAHMNNKRKKKRNQRAAVLKDCFFLATRG